MIMQGGSFARDYVSRSPFPPRLVRQMRWCNSLGLVSATTTAQMGTENVFRLNSCFDPDLTGGTHQPYGFDQMAALYAKYVVHRVRIRIIASTIAATKTSAVGIAVQAPTSTQVLTAMSLSDIIEKSMGDVLWMETAGRVSVFEASFDIARIAGVTQQQLRANIEDYAALISASPGQTPYLRIALANFQDTTQIGQSVYVVLDMDTEFFDRIELSSSN